MKTIKRIDIKECPPQATHAKFNPTNEFIELFYKIEKDEIKFLSTCGGGWGHSDSADKDKDFINKLIKIV
jgi:hypothetical protein